MENVHDFSGYEPTAKDPGWSLTIGVVIICILVNLSLPILVRLAARFDKRKEQQKGEIPRATRDEPNLAEREESEASKPTLKAGPQSRPMGLYQMPYNAPSIVSNAANSVVSVRSNVSTSVFSQVSAAILESRPHRLGQKKRKKYKQNHPPSIPIPKPDVLANVRSGVVRDLDDASSVCSKSVMSVLDQDAVSIQDAVDATDGNVNGGDNLPVLLEQDTPENLWEQFLEIADWDAESKRLAALTVPYTIQGCTEGLFQIINVALIGHHLGVMEANAYVVVTILLEFTGTLTYGFGEAIGTLVPHAHGAGNDILVGRYLQLSMLLFTFLSLPAIVVWCFYTYEAVLWFGFDEETATISQNFAYPFLVIMFLGGLDHPVHEFLDVTGHEKYSTVVNILYYAAQTLSIFVVVSFGVTDLVYIGIVQAFLGLIMSVSNLAYVLYRGWLDDYWEGFVKTLSLRDRRAVGVMMITAIPLSISWLLTYGEWEVLTIFASAMGPAEVAAWGMLGFVWDTFEKLTAGFADAAEMRVGFRMGSGQPHSAKIAAYKAIYMGVVVAVLSSGGLFIVSGYLPSWLTPDPTLQRLIFDALPLMGFGQILLIIGTVSWGIVGAQGRVRLATAIEFMTSWFVAIPFCAISLYVLNYNLVGFVAALVFGYTVGGVVMGFIILRSDWGSLSQTVISRNALEGVTWDDNDWEELPPHVQKAALCLGYTKRLWDNDEEPPSNDRDWDELSPQEKEAAQIMGFNKRQWDEESDTSDGDSQSEEKGKYDHLDWKALPSDVQKAAKVLGYEKKIWDSDQEPSSSDHAWNEMSPAEQEAATILGYNKKMWDKGDEGEESKPLNVNYDDMDWKELPPDVRAAAEILAYDETTWDTDGSPPSDGKYWHKLTEKEQEAAKKLGYTPKTWDDDSSSDVSSCVAVENRCKAQESKPLNVCYDDMDWKELSPDVRAAAEILGYDEKTWDTDGSPPSDDKYWHKLTEKEQEAAKKLGYTPKTWDDDSSSDVSSCVAVENICRAQESKPLNANYDDMDWKELPPDVRAAAEILGYDEKTWDTDGSPPSDGKYWHKLTEKEQEAAKKLGYTPKTWDDDSSSDDSTSIAVEKSSKSGI